ncbi:glycohydrolase toxin TNT-related protein [Frondihabitans australicus]|uniref:Uncharacterized protein DUF4237 n=1 Tax=Frondihabitans australicus TaxID=386892 RepID=A0A495ID59_9MICO|nr:glycohydrolase toxin TNT-related protein [Frondihabitans australicus]RKR73937.1 uncharacterized protein DUF4237 [Frondihabitans australicus]
MAGTVLDVDAQDFVTSSSHAASVARAISQAGATLRGALSGDSQMAGSDPTGRKWAAQYDKVAADAISGIDSLETAFGQIAAGLSVTGLNYATADWLSAGKSGHAPGYTVPSLPGEVCSAAPPSASGGTGSCDIPGWHYVADFIGDMWPDGDTGKLRHAKTAWSTFADTLDSIHGADIPRIISALDDTQTPEMPAIHSTVTTVKSSVSKLAQEARNLSSAAGQLADQIDHVHQQTEQELISLGEQLAATAAIGIGLTIFTAGLSDAAGALAGGGEIAVAVSRILGFIAELGTNVARVVDTVAESAGAIAKVAGVSEQITIRIVTIAGNSVVTGVGGGLTNIGVQEIVDPGADIDNSFVNGFVGGAAFGVVGEVGSMARVAAVKQFHDFKLNLKDWAATNGPAGYQMYGSLGEKAWFKTYFQGFDKKGYAQWKWPDGDHGFLNGVSKPNSLTVGQQITRLSAKGADGRFATDPGTSFGSMSLPPDRLAPNFVTTKYEVLKPLPPFIREGAIDPGFEQAGMGKQYFFPKGIDQLVKDGYLKVIP